MGGIEYRKPGKGKRTMAVIYSDTGRGKTLTTIKTAPKPMLYLEAQSKPVEQTCDGQVNLEKMQEDGDIVIGKILKFNDAYDELNNKFEEITQQFKTVFVDDYTYLSEYILLKEIQRETGKAKVFDKVDRPMVNDARTDMTGYGAVASYMADLTGSLGRIASAGVVVIVSALLANEPTYDRELSAGPNLAGRKFPETMGGFFDLVGQVRQRKNSEGEITYPPVIYFRSPDDDFMAKWSGRPLNKPAMVFDWGKILDLKREAEAATT